MARKYLLNSKLLNFYEKDNISNNIASLCYGIRTTTSKIETCTYATAVKDIKGKESYLS